MRSRPIVIGLVVLFASATWPRGSACGADKAVTFTRPPVARRVGDETTITFAVSRPTDVAVSDTHAYVNDTINLRVVTVRLNYAADATCPVE